MKNILFILVIALAGLVTLSLHQRNEQLLPRSIDETGDVKSKSQIIFQSAKASVYFAVNKTLIPYGKNLCSKSSFVDLNGEVMESIKWHPFASLEGPGWAANAVGGA